MNEKVSEIIFTSHKQEVYNYYENTKKLFISISQDIWYANFTVESFYSSMAALRKLILIVI